MREGKTVLSYSLTYPVADGNLVWKEEHDGQGKERRPRA